MDKPTIATVIIMCCIVALFILYEVNITIAMISSMIIGICVYIISHVVLSEPEEELMNNG